MLFGKTIGTSGVPYSYTATHYVDTHASGNVSGSSDDDSDLGATSFSNSTNSGTPTNLGTAMARASGANNVQIAPGDYITTDQIPSAYQPRFPVANDGTDGDNQLVFFAEYPASENSGNSALWTTFTRPGNLATITNITNANPAHVTLSAGHGWNLGDKVTIESVGGMTELNGNEYTITWGVFNGSEFDLEGVDSTSFGTYTSGGTALGPPASALIGFATGYDTLRARHDVVFDGFAFSHSKSYPAASDGIINASSCTDCYIRRCLFDVDVNLTGGGDNYAAIWFRETTGLVVEDCYFLQADGVTPDSSHNDSMINMYAGQDIIVRFNEFDGTSVGVFVKAAYGNTDDSNSGEIYNNYFHDGGGDSAINLFSGPVDPTEMAVYQNLIVNQKGIKFQNGNGAEFINFKVYNNTLIEAGVLYVVSGNGSSAGNEFYNNIIVGNTIMGDNPAAATDHGTNDLSEIYGTIAAPLVDIADYNCFYDSAEAVNFTRTTNNMTFAQFKTQLASDGVPTASRQTNSIEEDPQFSVGSGLDYKLSGAGNAPTAGNTGGPVGCYITGNETIGPR